MYTKHYILNLPYSTLRSKTKNEYSSACPVCGGYDRFRFWPDDNNFWCRRCGLSGFVDDSGETERVLPKVTTITSKTQEFEKWLEYFSEFYEVPEAREYWECALGPDYEKAVLHFGLGWCKDYNGLGPTAVIPISYKNKVYLCKHRLIHPAKGKYITEPNGVGAMLFNLDGALEANTVFVVEGEKKAIRLWLEGLIAVSSTTGANGFRKEWDLFLLGKNVYVIFDPDEAGQKSAADLCNRLHAKNILLPDKVDDLINGGFDIKAFLSETVELQSSKNYQ